MTTQPPSAPAPNDDLVPVDDIVADPTLVTELRRRRAITPVTRALLAVVVAGGAFLGGILVQKSQTKSTSTSALPSGVPANIAALFGGGTPTTVAGSGGSATTGATQTFGTIKLVDGKNVYVSDAQGNVVRVATNGSTKITVNQDATVDKLKPSTSVIVQGTRGSDGTITATSISQTAARRAVRVPGLRRRRVPRRADGLRPGPTGTIGPGRMCDAPIVSELLVESGQHIDQRVRRHGTARLRADRAGAGRLASAAFRSAMSFSRSVFVVDDVPDALAELVAFAFRSSSSFSTSDLMIEVLSVEVAPPTAPPGGGPCGPSPGLWFSIRCARFVSCVSDSWTPLGALDCSPCLIAAVRSVLEMPFEDA